MKKYIYALAITSLIVSSCVQKSYEQKVTFLLDVSAIKKVQSAGVRGNDKPFSWNEDSQMEVVKKDSLYKKTFTVKTGYLFTEIKFTINGEFELREKENRRVYFDKSRTTIFKAKFNKIK